MCASLGDGGRLGTLVFQGLESQGEVYEVLSLRSQCGFGILGLGRQEASPEPGEGARQHPPTPRPSSVWRRLSRKPTQLQSEVSVEERVLDGCELQSTCDQSARGTYVKFGPGYHQVTGLSKCWQFLVLACQSPLVGVCALGLASARWNIPLDSPFVGSLGGSVV